MSISSDPCERVICNAAANLEIDPPTKITRPLAHAMAKHYMKYGRADDGVKQLASRLKACSVSISDKKPLVCPPTAQLTGREPYLAAHEVSKQSVLQAKAKANVPTAPAPTTKTSTTTLPLSLTPPWPQSLPSQSVDTLLHQVLTSADPPPASVGFSKNAKKIESGPGKLELIAHIISLYREGALALQGARPPQAAWHRFFLAPRAQERFEPPDIWAWRGWLVREYCNCTFLGAPERNTTEPEQGPVFYPQGFKKKKDEDVTASNITSWYSDDKPPPLGWLQGSPARGPGLFHMPNAVTLDKCASRWVAFDLAVRKKTQQAPGYHNATAVALVAVDMRQRTIRVVLPSMVPQEEEETPAPKLSQEDEELLTARLAAWGAKVLTPPLQLHPSPILHVEVEDPNSRSKEAAFKQRLTTTAVLHSWLGGYNGEEGSMWTQWFTVLAAYLPRAADQLQETGKLMAVLQAQPNGTWQRACAALIELRNQLIKDSGGAAVVSPQASTDLLVYDSTLQKLQALPADLEWKLRIRDYLDALSNVMLQGNIVVPKRLEIYDKARQDGRVGEVLQAERNAFRAPEAHSPADDTLIQNLVRMCYRNQALVAQLKKAFTSWDQ